MFDKRLKIFLTLLLVMSGVLLLRSIQLQVFGRSYWADQAIDLNKHQQLIETTRGRILDCRGREIAVDEACIDACVEYPAIVKDPDWMEFVAKNRLKSRDFETYRRTGKDARKQLVDDEIARVSDDIDRMLAALARESNQTVEQIDEIAQGIRLSVETRKRHVQYNRFTEERQRHANTPMPWYRRWLTGADGPDLDNFAIVIDDEVVAHPILRDISPLTSTRLGRQLENFPGLELRPSSRRKYPYGTAGCHLLGQLAAVGQTQLDNSKANPSDLRRYLATDPMGSGGIEGMCESILRGTRGSIEKISGQEQPAQRVVAIAGGDVQSTIDIELQAQLQAMFQHAKVKSNRKDEENVLIDVEMHGAAVVIDVASGEVRALASYPDFDPNKLQDEYPKLVADKLGAPLMNRATQAQLEPGSTIKPVVGLGAITQGVWTTTKGIECTGYLVIGGRKYPMGRCWTASKFASVPGANFAHHQIPSHSPHHGIYGNPDGFLCFVDALERSCNVFFETLADLLGSDGLSYWFDQFGLGRNTGIGIAESTGRIPRDFAGTVAPKSVVWFSGIGQAQVLATPLQMANIAATIARDGMWVRPHIVRANVPAPLSTRTKQPIPDRVNLNLAPAAVEAAKIGMTNVVNGDAGTGAALKMSEVLIAGKTGTAQAAPMMVLARDASGNPVLDAKGQPEKVELDRATRDHQTATPWYRGWGDDGHELNHAWYIGFAPAKNPQIAFAVLVEYGGSGGGNAAPIAKGIIKACIEHGYLRIDGAR